PGRPEPVARLGAGTVAEPARPHPAPEPAAPGAAAFAGAPAVPAGRVADGRAAAGGRASPPSDGAATCHCRAGPGTGASRSLTGRSFHASTPHRCHRPSHTASVLVRATHASL